MKTNAKTFGDWIKKISMNGKVPSCYLDFGEDGIMNQGKTTDNVAGIKGLFKKESIKGYQTSKIEVGITNTTKLIKVLNSFKGDVDINIEESRIFLDAGESDANFPIAAKEFTDNYIEKLPGIFSKYDAGFEIDMELIRRVQTNIEIVESDLIHVSIVEGKLIIEAGEENGVKKREKAAVKYKNASGSYAAVFLDTIKCLGGKKVIVSMGDKENYPIIFRENTIDFSVETLISPYGDVKEKTEEKVETPKEAVVETPKTETVEAPKVEASAVEEKEVVKETPSAPAAAKAPEASTIVE